MTGRTTTGRSVTALTRVTAVAALVAALGLAAPSAAQERSDRRRALERLTVEEIYGGTSLRAERFEAAWRRDGESWVVVEADGDGHDELWEVEAESGDRSRVVSAAELVPDGAEDPIEIHDFVFSPDGARLLLFTDARRVWRRRTKGKYYVFDLEERSLRPLSEEPGWQWFAKFGPEGRRVAFVRRKNLHLVDLETGEERQLTTAGGGDVLVGRTDWVYEEELGLRDGFRWGPDGDRIAYWRFDRSPIPPFYLVDETRLYPELKPVRYPKAGTENSEVRVGSLDLASGRTTWFEVGDMEYLPRMEWVGFDRVAIQRMNRHQDRLEVLLGDPATGETERILTETDPAWVDVTGDLTWIDGGERFVWSSPRDGHRHLYLYAADGSLVRQLTRGAWPVTAFHGVDEERGRAWFTAARLHPSSRSVGWVPLGGGQPRWVAGPAAGRRELPEGQRLSSGEVRGDDPGGVHDAAFGPDFSYFFHTRSSFSSPPVTTLRRHDGRRVRTLVDNSELRSRLADKRLGRAEFFTVTAADDSTRLNAWRIRPPDFDPSGSYPVLLYVYGGPGVQTVVDDWGGTRYLWHQLMAQRGFVVVSVDNRGTGGRGRAFTRQTYLDLGALESADQLAAVQQLGALPHVDADRIGIWGWSYGGYMTLLTTLKSEGSIAAGASVAPVTHWKYYDTIYTERYMRTPGENPEGYRRSAPLEYAGRLDSELLIVHGTGDDNVHPQHTIRMIEELEKANEQFRMRLFPNKRHGIEGPDMQVNLFGMITDFFLEAIGPRARGGGAAATGSGG